MPKLFICSNATNELLPETNGSTMEAGEKGRAQCQHALARKMPTGEKWKSVRKIKFTFLMRLFAHSV